MQQVQCRNPENCNRDSMPEPISESLGVLYVIVNTLCALAMCNCDSVPEPISLTVGMLYVCVCELNTVIYTLCIGS